MGNVKRTSMNLDLDLVGEARAVLGTANTTDTVHAAMFEAVRAHHLSRLADWRPDVEAMERIEAAGLPRFADEVVAAGFVRT